MKIDVTIKDDVKYVGVEDHDIDLFESQYPVPNGVTYNSYLILDDKVAVIDSVDRMAGEEWMENIEDALNGRSVDYLIVEHMEPDHCANIQRLVERYPEAKVVGNAKTFPVISQFYGLDLTGRQVVVQEGDVLDLGSHKLTFIMAPMVHWPEVMFVYDTTDKILFSADAFGRFGPYYNGGEWDKDDEAGRYFLNIVGKYCAQVQAVLKKAAGLEIEMICPLHGNIHVGDEIAECIDIYNIWSTYVPEKHGVLIACGSIYGNTIRAAEKLAEILQADGEEEVEIVDLARMDVSRSICKAFEFDRTVFASVTLDGGLFPAMQTYLEHLRMKNFQQRTVGLMENGSWAPQSAKLMRKELETMKDITILEPVVTMKSAMNDDTIEQMKELAKALEAVPADF